MLGWWDLDRSDEAGRYIPLKLPVRFADTRWHPWASELRPIGLEQRQAREDFVPDRLGQGLEFRIEGFMQQYAPGHGGK